MLVGLPAWRSRHIFGSSSEQEAAYWFTIASIIVGLLSVILAITIYRLQKKSGRLLEDRIFGTLESTEAVVERATEMLKDCREDPDSLVSAMLYWLWFGADLKFPVESIQSIQDQHSDVCLELNHRIHSGLPTHLFVLRIADETGDQSRLQRFLRAVFDYRKKTAKRGSHQADAENEALLLDLLDRYRQNLNLTVDYLKTKPSSPCVVSQHTDIPTLLLATESKGRTRGIIYLGETPTLERTAKTGGFYTEDSRMVEIIRSQIEELVNRERNNRSSETGHENKSRKHPAL